MSWEWAFGIVLGVVGTIALIWLIGRALENREAKKPCYVCAHPIGKKDIVTEKNDVFHFKCWSSYKKEQVFT